MSEIPTLAYAGAAAFAAAILLLDTYTISMPRGDSIGVSGSLVAACILCIGPWWGLLAGTMSVILVQTARHLRKGDGSLNEVWVRAVSALAAVGVWSLMHGEAAWAQSAMVVIVPSLFLLSEIAARQAALSLNSGRSFRRLIEGNLSRQSLLFASEVSVAALTVVLYDAGDMGAWALLPVLPLLLLIRQSYAMLLEIRETYHTTFSVLIDVAESPEPGRDGHSERVAEIARSIGSKCGLTTPELERLSYAALLHDISCIADSDEPGAPEIGSSADVVREVAFLEDVVPILRVAEGQKTDQMPSERVMLNGYIVALASDVDSADHPEVRAAHGGESVAKLTALVPPRLKAKAVAAAVGLGYSVPAID